MILCPMNAAQRVLPYIPPPMLCFTALLMPTTLIPSGRRSVG